MQTAPISTSDWPPLTLEELEKILDIEDDQLRNLRVTLGYHSLSQQLGEVLGCDNANWCTFAVWASRQAGIIIRGEVAGMAAVRDFVVRRDRARANKPHKPHKHHKSHPPKVSPFAEAAAPPGAAPRDPKDWGAWTRWLRRAHSNHWNDGRVGPLTLILLVFASFSRATSQGNTDVFEDIGRQFLPFIKRLRHSNSLDDPKMKEFLSKLNPLPARDGGQQELKVGLDQYWKAKHTTDPGERARLMLYANCCVGFHEQTRLDDAISRAVDTPIDYLRDDLVMWYTYGLGSNAVMRSLVGWPLHSAIRRALIPTVEFVAQRVWQAIATGWVMELSVPGETFTLGRNLPPLPTGAFPVPLRAEELRPIDADLFAWLSFAAPNRLTGTGARDWTSLPERMNTICNLFRSRQQQPSLFRAPFSVEQTDVIHRGLVPEGSLGGPRLEPTA